MMIAKIVFFSNLRKIFDYIIPKSIEHQTTVATRVKVSFGNKNKILIGFIVNITTLSEIPEDKLKPILELIDIKPILPISLYNTLLWAANYYKSSIGEILDCALPTYFKKNIIPKIDKNINKQKFAIKKLSSSEDLVEKKTINLNLEQQNVINKVLQHNDNFNINLLEGVTGSGKTEIYLQLTAAMLQKNKQILILVPEIGLTSQTLKSFTERFSNIEIVILHSSLTLKQRYLNWVKAKDGVAKIILGTRSAAFVPLADPGLFIIDEEHDLSFKQQAHCQYMARDFLIMRAKFSNCQILLGSATPSLESLYNTKLKKYYHYKLPNRAISKLPEIEIIDIRHKKLSSGLSNYAIKTIDKYLESKQQVLLFINRRGFAPVLKCLNCKFIQKCASCDAKMIMHIYTNKLHCHHCQSTKAIPENCPNCQQPKLIPLGQGTERLEQLLQKLFPTANIARIDRDSVNPQNFDKILEEILSEKINLLVGTQMIAKGHHFPNLGLVVIIDLDNALFSSDFRSTERFGQLIIQVAGRAGREKPGKVLLQTAYPNNQLIQAIKDYDYPKFCNLLLEERKTAELPPFSHQILWKAEAKTLKACIEFLIKVKELVKKITKFHKNPSKIFGPIPAIMEKCNNKYHARLLLQNTHRNTLQEIHDNLIKNLIDLKIKGNVAWKLDIDPKEIF